MTTAGWLELTAGGVTTLVTLDREQLSVGAGPANDVVLEQDRTASRLHAVFVSYPSGWAVKDIGSRNGTFVNGQRLWGERLLRSGDEVRVGRAQLVFHADEKRGGPKTQVDRPPVPPLTPRERDVLIALCRPVVSGHVFTQPASLRDVARELEVSVGAVKGHLARLYKKFDVPDEGERRRVLLANEVMARGVLSVTDLQS
jgi:DNA-binding CsgD family transcriptional regulator